MVAIGKVDIEVESVLDELGVEIVDRGENLLCKCPFHEDSHRSFAVSAKSGAWICYAGCGEGGLLQLVVEVQGVGRDQARLWLEDRGTFGGREDKVLELLEDPEEAHREQKLYFYETGSTYSYMFHRGFTPETLKAWSVGRDTPREAVVIPINFEGRLSGLIYRHIYPEVDPPYEYTYGLQKSQLLFGWDMLPEQEHP